MVMAYVLGNMYNMYKKDKANKQGLSATEQLIDKMKAQYNDPGIGQRPPDPSELIASTEAMAEGQGGQAALKYLLGQTDPAQLAQVQAQEQKNRQSAMDAQAQQRRFQAFNRGIQQAQGGLIPDITPAMATAASMQKPQQAGATLASATRAATTSRPSSVREYEYYDKLPSDKDRQDYLSVKRAQKTVGTGGGGRALLGPGGQLQPLLTPEDFANAESQTDITLTDDKRRYGEQVALPAIRAESTSMLKIADDALEHPGFDSHYGWLGVIPAAPGSDAANFAGFVNQGQGRVFLQAYESLKGAGQITEVEGLKAEQAMARIADRKQSPESARKAWRDLQDVVKSAQRRKETSAATSYDATGPTNRVGEGGRFRIRERR